MRASFDLFPENILLDGQLISIAELLKLEKNGLGWETEWLDFLKEWYNDSEFIQVQTSGSTGTPKLIHLKKDFVAASAKRTLSFFKLKAGDRILHCLPSRYIAGKLMVIRALIGGLNLVVCDPSNPGEILEKQNFRFAAMVPNQVIKLLNKCNGELNLDDLLIGGAAVSEALTGLLQEISTRCYSSYAMTETATHIALRRLNGLSVVDEDYHCLDGITVSLSERDCLKIKMNGLENGFIETTDLAELKDDKTFRILGRADDVIISGGIKYMPEKIEKKLVDFFSVPFVISAVDHEVLGQQIVLVLETNAEDQTDEDILTFCRKQLSKYECPKAIFRIADFPRTPTGKIKRKAILKQLKS